MKDIVFLVVDSMMESYVMHKDIHSTTPFLDSIKDNCICFNNVYSQGPFTEAGTLGLLTASDTLDDCNYLFRYDNSKSFITDIFKKVGYETYSLIYPTCLYSGKILHSIDHVFYTAGMIFDVFWTQKFSYFINLIKENDFDELDEQICIRLLKIIFEAWLSYFDPNNEECRELLDKFDIKEADTYFDILNEEYRKFSLNPSIYTMDFLQMNGSSPLNSIASDFSKKIIQNKAIIKAFSKNTDFVSDYKRKQFWLNLRNNRTYFSSLSDLPERIKKGINKYTFGEFAYRIELLLRGRDINTIKNGHDYKLLLSANTQMNKIADILIENHTIPRFVTAHVEEPHYFTTYFTYDSKDVDLIDNELKYAGEYIANLPSNYKGLLSYDLSIRYIDKQIENLFSRLKDAGRLKDTVVVITADHGSSYNFDPPRSRSVNNCHSENYHIPFIIYDEDVVGKTINTLSANKNIIPTVLDHIGMQNSHLKGTSLFSDESIVDYITTEYMGSGCPDLRRKTACINVRSNNYLVAFEGNILNDFSEKNIYAIYDLKKDPKEVHNIKKKRNDEINDMILFLKKRINEIRDNNKEWLKKA